MSEDPHNPMRWGPAAPARPETSSPPASPSISWERVVAGFLISPLIVAIPSAIWTFGTYTHAAEQYVVPQALLAVGMAFIGTFLLGVPAFLIMRRRSWTKLHQLLAAGIILGVAYPQVVVLLTGWNLFRTSGYSARFAVEWYATSIVYGAAIAFVFWLIAVRGAKAGG